MRGGGSVAFMQANDITRDRLRRLAQVDDQATGEALEMKTRMVSGVRDVRNMLHLPGETPPNIVGTPGASSS